MRWIEHASIAVYRKRTAAKLAKLIEENQYIKAVEVEGQELNHWSSNYLDIDHVLYPSTQ